METGETQDSSCCLQTQKHSRWEDSWRQLELERGRELGRELGLRPEPEGTEGGTWVDIWGGSWQKVGTSSGFAGRTSWRKLSYPKKCRFQ